MGSVLGDKDVPSGVKLCIICPSTSISFSLFLCLMLLCVFYYLCPVVILFYIGERENMPPSSVCLKSPQILNWALLNSVAETSIQVTHMDNRYPILESAKTKARIRNCNLTSKASSLILDVSLLTKWPEH